MSHTMNIKTEIKDINALRATADRLGYRATNRRNQVIQFNGSRDGRILTELEISGSNPGR